MPIAIRRQRSSIKNSSSALTPLFVSLLMLVCLVATQAQSGRNAGRRNPTSAPASDSTPAPPRSSSSATPHQKISFIVARYIQSPNVSAETLFAFNGFVKRLSDSSAVEVVPVQTDMTRKQAIDRAKSEESAYVVWLRVEVDTADTEIAAAGAPINPGCLLVSYTVYSPQTAKVKAQGRVYQRGYAPNLCVAPRGNPLPPREPAHLPYEYRIKVAGSDAADRVFQAFDLSLPSTINSSTDDLR